jgi:hydrogenase maturation protein HypF
VRTQLTVRGVVQGVGFRPFVYNLAERLGLCGWVLNHSGGVEIEAEGAPSVVATFVAALREEAPPLAQIESLEAREAPPQGYEGFEIRHSVRQEGRYQLVSPDIATCPDCLRELLDPNDRRYRYPFTNCTNCGPRFTIIADIPYDRPNTTMRVFPMCPDCQREYDDPRDRRFHAQPNACPVCGPRVELVEGDELQPPRNATSQSIPSAAEGRNTQYAARNTQYAIRNTQHVPDALSQAASLLRSGWVLAIKGLGGFHLACDATNGDAVRTLRARKRRPDKPFAVMVATLDEVTRHCRVSPEEKGLLTSPQCPIVLLPWDPGSDIADEVAPGYRHLGVMLPYTPLHHILLRDVDRPLVMTSGNLTEEPIAAENDEARQRLGHLADAFLLHDRDIYARYDDSVWFVPTVEETSTERTSIPQPIRRARGYAPFPIKVPFQMGQILACGAEIKNTFCLTRDEYAFVSQHIGDMENLETLEHYRRTIALYKRLFRIEPETIAYDLHPDYMATRYAQEQLATFNLQPATIQHHHAHLAACLADNGWPADSGPVIGVIMDGTGYGADGHIWGGEWLVGDYRGFQRAAHLEYLPLPGGDAATRNPWRIAFSYLYTLLGEASQFVQSHGTEAETRLLRQQLDRQVNCPLTSAMGRLFDAVSALLGVCTRATYEAQAAIELEQMANIPKNAGSPLLLTHLPATRLLGCPRSAARRSDKSQIRQSANRGPYPFEVERVHDGHVVRLRKMFVALLGDVERSVSVAEIGWRFHCTVTQMIVQVCQAIAEETGLRTVALSGGCFQNRILLRLAVPALQSAGFDVLLHRQVPCNDGGLSLGQAVIAQFFA